MSVISTTIPNLVNGVSQQPYALRLASQSEEQVNAYSSVVEGLRKRPPTRHVAKFLDVPLTGAHVTTINRDASERYLTVITPGDLRVFRLDGSQVTVNFPNGKGYLASAAPETDFAVVTVADFTFISNKTIAVAQDASNLVPTRPFEALYWIRQGNYTSNYSITVDGSTFTYTTLGAENAANAYSVQTDYIAGQLYTQMVAAGLNSGTSAVGLYGSVIYLANTSHQFTTSTKDSLGDTLIRPMYGSVQRFSDLPAKGVPGFKIQIRGTNENAFDDYWVEFSVIPSAANGGVWKETAKPGEVRGINESTMPHVLVREADGTFTFSPQNWDDRLIGTTDSTPMPSFVGKKISDVFFHRNRLGFLADENVIFSASSEFTNFFPASAIQVLDTDPIDIAVSHVKVSNLRHAVPFNESLLLFSDQTQFILGKAELLTPSTISINQTTEFQCSLKAKPVGAGTNVYFAVQRGAYSGIREYYVDGDSQQNDATDVTAHCPKYVPKNVIKLAASSNEDALVALSAEVRNRIYLYRYFWSQKEKLQSSWSYWEFPAEDSVLNCDFIESDLWMVVSRPDGAYIEVISLEPGRVDTGASFVAALDRRINQNQVTGKTYNAGANLTTMTLPWTIANPAAYQLVAWGETTADFTLGEAVPFTISGTTMTVTGQLGDFYFGLKFNFRYRFSTLIIRESAQAGGGMQPVGEGRIQLRHMNVTFNETGYFKATVMPLGGQTYNYVFSGRVLGSAKNVLGQPAIESGTFRFPISAKNDRVTIELSSDSYAPCSFLSAEWEAFFQLRSKRL